MAPHARRAAGATHRGGARDARRANKRWKRLKGTISEDVGGTYSAASRIQRSWTQAAALDSGIQLGKLRFEQTKSSASVAVVPGMATGGLQRRADALAVDVNWRMPRPDVIFAITGGAKDLALAEGQEHALRLAMETAAELERGARPAGTNVGLSSMFGQWRETRDEEGSPLIGIARRKVHAHDQVLEYRGCAGEGEQGSRPRARCRCSTRRARPTRSSPTLAPHPRRGRHRLRVE